MTPAIYSLSIPTELQKVREGMKTEQTVAESGGAEFADIFSSMVGQANASTASAAQAGEAFAAGSRDDIHGTMLAVSQADIELRVLGSVRNRVIDAFYELWRMQI
jgi:flagellar hook-basal body complex protein FliE